MKSKYYKGFNSITDNISGRKQGIKKSKIDSFKKNIFINDNLPVFEIETIIKLICGLTKYEDNNFLDGMEILFFNDNNYIICCDIDDSKAMTNLQILKDNYIQLFYFGLLICDSINIFEDGKLINEFNDFQEQYDKVYDYMKNKLLEENE